MSEPGAIVPETSRVRFRLPRSSYLAVGFLVVGITTLLWIPWLAVLYVIPVLVAFFIARRGTDVDAAGVTIHALLRSEHFPWPQVRGVYVTDAGKVVLALRGEGDTVAAVVALPCVGINALPVVAEASGGALPELPAASVKAAPGRQRRR